MPAYCAKHASLLSSSSVGSDSLRPHGLQHARLPCPSPSPGACSNSCPLSQWCHPTISSSVAPFSSCPQSFPASHQPFASSGGQFIEASASASALPMNIQGRCPLELTGLISLLAKRLSRVFSSTTVWNHQFFGAQLSLWPNSHIRTWLLEKPYWLFHNGCSHLPQWCQAIAHKYLGHLFFYNENRALFILL